MNYSPFYILYIAINVASLTYVLGSLFYGFPIPIYGLKKWGPRMMSDAIYAGVWVNIYGFIITFINQIQGLLGIDWNTFYALLTNLEVQMFDDMTILKSMYYILTVTRASAAAPILAPILQFSSFLSDIIFLTQFLIDLGIFIQATYMLLISIGILLLSLPFRMGKGIGGTLIASTMIFYVGLPYLPVFVNNIASLLPQVELQSLSVTELNYLTETIIGVVPSLIISYIILPIIYLSILAGLSLGLGNAIGGSSGKLPFPLDLF